ncbi:MAG: glycosyltransferase family 2 protein [Actinomycetes bacterium]
MKLSVIIPAFNAARWLGQQLDALSEQRAAHPRPARVEIIVADNGSTDGTRSVVQQRTTPASGVRWVDAGARRGPAAARNLGAGAAQGERLAFVDADDVVGPGWLAAVLALSAGVELATGPAVSFLDPGPLPEVPSGPGRPFEHMGFLPYADGSNTVVVRSVFTALGGFPEEYRTGEDVVFSWRAQRAGMALTYVPNAIVFKRRPARASIIARKAYGYGRSDPEIYREFHPYGCRRSPTRVTVGVYLGLVARLPGFYRIGVRQRWAAQLGRRAGRLVGSASARLWFP